MPHLDIGTNFTNPLHLELILREGGRGEEREGGGCSVISQRKVYLISTMQTAYRKGVSCAEAIVLSIYSQRCEKCIYMCFYDLQKAFDSVHYSVLLKRLYEAGVDGRAWRLLRSWYASPKSMVRVDGSLSSMFTLERGVLQGSVLSPVLFLLIMDPLLKSLQSKALGPSIGDTYVGAFIHADDIRTISSSRATLQEQIDTVQTFAVQNGLTLNPTKCEVVLVSPSIAPKAKKARLAFLMA